MSPKLLSLKEHLESKDLQRVKFCLSYYILDLLLFFIKLLKMLIVCCVLDYIC